ncbi:MAG: hypothetical protein DWQ31_05805 [Planctomycetota bacterium]|nr:MAG: hypothetical protein DWQ31_05805 [Planctomycetota bacterium]REJ90269.1 MAG: hypothetical protein DWQ35_16440 [Planctomycetota bacterium]
MSCLLLMGGCATVHDRAMLPSTSATPVNVSSPGAPSPGSTSLESTSPGSTSTGAPQFAETSKPIIRGQQPAYGQLPTNPLPGEGVYPPRSTPFAPPPPGGRTAAAGYAAGQVPQQGGRAPGGAAGYPVTQLPQRFPQPGQQQYVQQPAGGPASQVTNQIWYGQVPGQTVSQPPFVPQVPLVTPDEPLDLRLDLAETPTGRLVIGAGINSDAGLIGNIVVDEQNFDLFRWPSSFRDFRNGTAFRGGGQRFRLEALPGTEVQRYSFNFLEPYLLQSPVSFGVSGSYFDRIFPDWDEERKTARLSLGYIFPRRPDLSTTVSVRYENINISDPSVPALPDLAAVLGNNDLVGIRWQVAHDTRDSTVLPTEGHLIQLSFEQVVGTFDYPVFRGDYRKYYVITERPDGSGRHILGLAGRLGFSGEDTPIYERFFAGGFSSIRGFDFRGASPTSAGVIVGGEFEAIFSAEYRFPLTANDQIFGSFFLDVGTVEEVVDITASDIRITPGFEVRVQIPQLGPIPIAVGLGFPIQHEDGDDIRNFHFFVGISR